MRGRPDGLLPIEAGILAAGIAFHAEGVTEFHGFRVSARLKEETGAALFSARGSLYKALDRLEKRGFLASRWEDAALALEEGRPRRRLYRVTADGEAALHENESSRRALELRKAPV